MTKRWIGGAVGLVASAALAACGGKVIVDGARGAGEGGAGASGAGGGAIDAWAAYCDARAAACGIAADLCKAEEACARALLRDEVEATLLGCLATSCGPDGCFKQIAEQFPPTAKGQELTAACAAYLGACPD